MPATIVEKPDSREWTDGESGTLKFTVYGAASKALAIAALYTGTSVMEDGLIRGKATVEPIPGQLTSFNGTVPYAKPGDLSRQQLAEGEVSVTYDTGGATQHITQSLSTISKTAPAGETAPDQRGAIGVTKDDVAGVDVLLRQFELTVVKVFDIGDLPDPVDLFATTGLVNDDTVEITDTRTSQAFTFAAGELLFKGASGPSIRQDGLAEISYSFSASPNATDLPVGTMTVPAKGGWEHLWVLYEDDEDGAAKRLVKKPLAAYVEKVYKLGDFTVLGL